MAHSEGIEVSLHPRKRITTDIDTIELLEIGVCDAPDLANLINSDPHHLDSILSIAGKVCVDDMYTYTWDRPETVDRLGIWNDGTLRGMIELIRKPDKRKAEIGYWIGKEHTGQGFAWRAQRLLTSAVLTRSFTPSVDAVFTRILPTNEASIHTSEKAGFKPQKSKGGRLRFIRTLHDELSDSGTRQLLL